MHSVAGRRRLETQGLSRVPLEHGKLKQVRPLRARLLRAAVWSGTIIAAKIAENSKNTQGMAKKGFINVKQGFVTSCRNKDSGTCTHVLVAFLCVFMYINQSFFPSSVDSRDEQCDALQIFTENQAICQVLLKKLRI